MFRRLFALAALLGAGSFSAFASIDSGLLALVPPGSQVIASIDVARARDSQFGQFLMNRINTSDSNFQQFLAETGFDPRRDLQDVVFASPSNSNANTVVLARGNFDISRIEAAAKAHGGSVESYRGVNVILNSGRRQDSAVAFLSPEIAVMGDLGAIEGVIRNQNVATVLDPALQQLVSNAGSNDAWFASMSAGALAAPDLSKWNRPAGYAVQAVTEAAGGIRFGDPILLTLDAITASPENAASLAAVLRVLANTLQIQRQTNPGMFALASALSTMNVAVDGNNLHLSLSIPEKDAEQLASFRPNANATHPR